MRYLLCSFLLITISFLVQAQKIIPYAPELFPTEISGAVCGFSENGKRIFFVREDTLKDKLFLYEAERKGDKWMNERLLSFSGEYNDMGGRLDPDGNTFYFTSDRPGGSTNESDTWNIWKVSRTNKAWSSPEPISGINNNGNECCPLPMGNNNLIFSGNNNGNEWQMLLWDGKEVQTINALTYDKGWQWPSSFDTKNQLIFFNSMKRPDTQGMDDIYVSFFKDQKWSTPANLGGPVNTSIYEDGAILSPDGKYLIFNQHKTGATPSQVMMVKWKSVLKNIQNQE